jgi:hypothetical protein
MSATPEGRLDPPPKTSGPLEFQNHCYTSSGVSFSKTANRYVDHFSCKHYKTKGVYCKAKASKVLGCENEEVRLFGLAHNCGSMSTRIPLGGVAINN